MRLESYEEHPLMLQMREVFGPEDQAREAFSRAVPAELLPLLRKLEAGQVMPWHLQSFADDLATVLPPLLKEHLPLIEGLVATMLLHPQLPDYVGLVMDVVGRTTIEQCGESNSGTQLLEWMVEVFGRSPEAYDRIHVESDHIRARAPTLGHRYRSLAYDDDEPLDVRLDALFETIGRLLEAGYKPYSRFVGELAWMGCPPPKSPPRMLGQVVARARQGLEEHYPRFLTLIDPELVKWRNHQSHDDRVFDRTTGTLLLGPGGWNLSCDEGRLIAKLQEVDGLIGLDGGFQRALLALPHRLFGTAITEHVQETMREAQKQAERSKLMDARNAFVSRIGNERARRFLLGESA